MDDRFDFVCFGDDWGRYQTSNQHLMRAFASLGHRVVWINSIGARMPRPCLDDMGKIVSKARAARAGLPPADANPLILSPLALPLPQYRWARGYNVRRVSRLLRSVLTEHSIAHPLLWLCGPIPAEFIGRLGERASIYYCADEYAALPRAPVRAVASLEALALRKADLTVVVSQPLLARKGPAAKRVALLPHGVDVDHFARARAADTTLPDDVTALPRPIIMLMGAVDAWTDTELLSALARRRPYWSVVVVGPVKVAARGWVHRNLHCLGPRPYAQLPAYLKAAQVAIMPYRVNDQTLNANPLKLREYLAAGKPVVAVPIPEVQRYAPPVLTALGAAAFADRIQQALATDNPEAQEERARVVAGESWVDRAGSLSVHLQSLLAGGDLPAQEPAEAVGPRRAITE